MEWRCKDGFGNSEKHVRLEFTDRRGHIFCVLRTHSLFPNTSAPEHSELVRELDVVTAFFSTPCRARCYAIKYLICAFR